MTRPPASQDRVDDVACMVAKSGIGETAQKLGLAESTVRRYVRAFKQEERSPAKILLFDIETAPMEVTVWGLYKQRIPTDNIIKDWSVLTWAAKWLYAPEVISAKVSTDEAFNRQDRSILGGIWDLFEQADIVIAHNAQKFDVRKLKSRWILNDFKPPAPYQVIDTLKESRKHFAHSSHKLDFLQMKFRQTRKIPTNYELWQRCVNHDADALVEMQTYNKQDVFALEELYLKIRPWITSHPNLGVYDLGDAVCAYCGHGEFEWVGHYYTPAGRYRTKRCKSCGGFSRERYADLTLAERRKLHVANAR